jgi:hypothetical protein
MLNEIEVMINKLVPAKCLWVSTDICTLI